MNAKMKPKAKRPPENTRGAHRPLGGRPSSYRVEYAEQATKLCKLGATDRDLAEFFGVAESTLQLWKHTIDGFSDALKLGKEAADSRVVQSLYRRATGYTFDSVKILQNNGRPVIVPYAEHVPPDTTACIFWLKNRDKENWRDKHESEISGPNGGPFEVATVDASKLSKETLMELMRARRGEGKPSQPG